MPMIADAEMELIDDGEDRARARSRDRKGVGFRTLERGRIPDDVKVVWKPHFGSQSLALSSPAKETLYHGPRGPGKTDCQLMRFRRNVGVGYGAFWRGIIFDVEYRDLEDIVAKSLKWFPQFDDGAEFKMSAKDYKWVWPSGEQLLFRAGSTIADYNKFHGHEYCLVEGERVMTARGLVAIESLRIGDMALTPVGYRRVNAVFPVGLKECVHIFNESGRLQTQSSDHCLLSDDGAWKVDCFRAMRYDEISSPGFSFKHPYTNAVLKSIIGMSGLFVNRLRCGMKECWDIEVDGVNCYFTESGLLNKNCFIGFNELCKQPTPEFYNIIKSCNRSSFKPEIDSPDAKNPLPPIPLEVFSTANPHGAGHNWVKKYFIDAGEPGQIVKTEVKILSPKTRKEEIVTSTKTHVFGHWIENGKLPEAYIADLVMINDENRRKAWAHGDWNVDNGGGVFNDIWDHRYVRRPRFKIPPQWKKDRCFDWGSTTPFYVAWVAEADGSEVEIPLGEGRTTWWGPPRGSLIVFHEWYGSTSWTSNVGLRIGPKAIADGIAAREKMMREKEWIVGDVKPGPADNQIHNQNDVDTDSIAKRMALPPAKIRWTESDKSRESRVSGVQLMRDMLLASVNGDGPGFFIMEHCQAALNLLPELQRDQSDPDDVAKDSKDHPWDALRYRILDRKRQFSPIETRWYGGA